MMKISNTIKWYLINLKDEIKRNELMVYLNSIKAENFINSNNERNIDTEADPDQIQGKFTQTIKINI